MKAHFFPRVIHFATPLCCFTLALVVLTQATAQAGVSREWANSAGKKLTAEFLSHDVENATVTIKTDKGKTYTLKVNSLSEPDQQWLQERLAHLQQWVDKKGTSTAVKFKGHPLMRGRVFCPENFSLDRPPPVVICIGTGGDGSGLVRNLEKSLNKVGAMAIGTSGFGRTIKPEVRNERFKLLMQYVEEKLPHSDVYLMGFSDGVARCVDLACFHQAEWKGLLACSGGLDDSQELTDFPSRLKVVFSVGKNDFYNDKAIVSASSALSSAGATVQKVTFKGGNQLPPQEELDRLLKRFIDAG